MRAVLRAAGGFDLYQRLVGAQRSKRQFVEEHVRPRPGERVLDLGCGTGALRAHMPRDVEYVGVDVERRYIERALERYGDGAQFVVADATTYEGDETFDLAIAYGVLHHLDDANARALVRNAARAAPRFVVAEPVATPTAGRVESFFMRHDRGRYIRGGDDYARLLGEGFPDVESALALGTYRVPFSLVVLDGRR